MDDLERRIRAEQRPRFAAWLRDAMAERGMTQAELAETLGVTPAAVSQWANGRSAPDPVRLSRLAQALDTGLADLRGAGVLD